LLAWMLPQTAQNKILPLIPTAAYNYKARVFYNTLQQRTDNTKQNNSTYYKVCMEYNLIQLQRSTF
jgi:hypothetical protein